MKVKSPLTFRRKNGEVVLQGDAVDASEVEGFKVVTAPEPYETKVVREVAADDPRPAVNEDAAKPVKKTRKTAKKAK